MGIYERQRHLVPTGVWGEPFRLDADAVAMPLPLAAFPSVTVATPAPLDVVEPEAEEIKLGKRLLQAQQDDVPRMQEAPPSSDSFSHDDDDARPRDKVQRRLAQNREAARKSRLRKKVSVSAKRDQSPRACQANLLVFPPSILTLFSASTPLVADDCCFCSIPRRTYGTSRRAA